MRRLWVQVHLWLGLTLGAIGIVIGLSGSFLVYDHEIDAWLNPQRYAVSGSEASRSFAEYAASVRQAVPETRIVGIRMPEEGRGPIVVTARGQGAVFHRVYVDPPTGKVLEAVAGGGLIGWVHRFHENLTLREYWGREIVGAVGIAMLISSLSGLYLWWPARGRFKEALGTRKGVVLSRNLHYLLGFYGCLVLALLSFTGIWLAYVDAGRAVVSAFSPLAPRTVEAGAPGGKPIAPDAAVSTAQALYPGARVTGLGLPNGERGVYRVNLQDKRGPISVFLEPGSGAVLRRTDAGSRSGGDRFLAVQRGLHGGELLGPARVLLFLGGLLPGVLAVTGTMMWLRQRRRKSVATSSSDVAAQPEENPENATAASAMRR